MYPEFLDQAAVLAVRISRNHPLLYGNKRLAWGCLTMFCALNGHDLDVPADDDSAGVAAPEPGGRDTPNITTVFSFTPAVGDALTGWEVVVLVVVFGLFVGLAAIRRCTSGE
jgi:prophage maintenance system killer protein